jgi:hypothetical protein
MQSKVENLKFVKNTKSDEDDGRKLFKEEDDDVFVFHDFCTKLPSGMKFISNKGLSQSLRADLQSSNSKFKNLRREISIMLTLTSKKST